MQRSCYKSFMGDTSNEAARPSPLTLTPNQVVALNLEEARADKRWTQMETVHRLRPFGLRWSRPAYALAVGSPKGKRSARFDANQLIAFARTFARPAWWFLVPPVDWHGNPVKVRLSGESGGGTLDHRAMFEIATGPLSLPEARSEEERRRRDQETGQIVERVMQFLYDRNLLPKRRPQLSLLNLPPEARADLEKAVARVLKKHGIAFEPTTAPERSSTRHDLFTKVLEPILESEKENH